MVYEMHMNKISNILVELYITLLSCRIFFNVASCLRLCIFYFDNVNFQTEFVIICLYYLSS
jgi:hypothetical protein